MGTNIACVILPTTDLKEHGGHQSASQARPKMHAHAEQAQQTENELCGRTQLNRWNTVFQTSCNYSFFSQDKPQNKVWTRATEMKSNKHYDALATE